MPLDEPGWWYRDGPTLASRLLAPVAWAWGEVAERRFRRARPARAAMPIICIGNLTAGGTGKTPFALLVADRLARLGRRPAFLTRGYGGRIRGPHLVDLGVDSARDVGDEPLLLARAAPVIVAVRRAAGAAAAPRLVPAADVLVMDDGLQNPSLAKDLVIAVVDGRRGFGNGRVMPAGPLRASLDAQLGWADAIVVNTVGAPAPGDPSTLLDRLRRDFKGPVLQARTEPKGDYAWLRGASVLAFAGIGAPERFLATLAGLGSIVVDTMIFPDHHTFSETEAYDLLDRAAGTGMTLVTTEKDLVRLDRTKPAQSRLADAARAVAIGTVLEPAELDRLDALLRAALGGTHKPI